MTLESGADREPLSAPREATGTLHAPRGQGTEAGDTRTALILFDVSRPLADVLPPAAPAGQGQGAG